MFQFITKTLSIVATFALLAGLTGCSRDVITGTATGPGSNSVEYYFPLTEGYTTEYRVTRPNGSEETIRFEVGASVSFPGSDAREWFAYDASGKKSTSYVEATSSALFIYETAGSAAERVLSMPLIAGSSWSRFGAESNDLAGGDQSDTTGGGIKGLLDQGNGEDNGDKGGGTGTDYSKNFPTDGSGNLTVERIETVVLSDGSTYSGSLKIKNGGSTGVNYYWFAPGVGLVRYAIGASLDGNTSGATVGELQRFWTN